ncbi:MAG TPA: putative metal-dependent hydrolase [Candidatus Limnocylindrales bacterium]|nr:putative metal-dependent hydrolase [Candidatus Limnocylindrales bacterium]
MEDLRYPIGKFEWVPAKNEEQMAQRRAKYIDVLAKLPENFSHAVTDLTSKQLDTPYRPEGWTVRQLIHHVPDSHANAYIRFKLALTEYEPAIKPYKEDMWAKLPDTANTPIDVSLQLLDALHVRWATLLRAMDSSDFARTLRHPELGVLNLNRMLALYAWHSAHHTAHITKLRERMGW